jgi:hypothetical protein
MKIIKYETEIFCEGPKIFLAGCTVRGNQPHLTSWRREAEDLFRQNGFDGTLIVPEFKDKTASDKHRPDLPIWEFTGLRMCDCIMFWIPRTRELIGLTTNHEFGYWMARDRRKVIYGRPDDAYRMAYLDIMWKADADIYYQNISKRPSAIIYHTLPETVKAAIELATQRYGDYKLLTDMDFLP